jgi:thiol:disulfide interchange protein DsbD
MLGIAPKQAFWVVPVVLVVGGVFLGFFEKSADQRRGFRWLKRAAGAAAVAAGVTFVVTTPTRGIEFQVGTLDAVRASIDRGRPVIVDFTASWCLACHELERNTFSHPDVIKAARDFDAYRVDLTKFDSPEAQAWKKEYGIAGLPTVLFLGPDGREVEEVRVVGFVPPPEFRERLVRASRKGQRAERE